VEGATLHLSACTNSKPNALYFFFFFITPKPRVEALYRETGLTLARLDAVEGATLHLSALDLVDGTPVRPQTQNPRPLYVAVVSDSRYLSTLDAVYVYVVPWSEFPIVPSYPHYPHETRPRRNPQLQMPSRWFPLERCPPRQKSRVERLKAKVESLLS